MSIKEICDKLIERGNGIAKNAITVILLLGCFVMLWALQDSLLRMKDSARLSAASPFAGKNPGEFVGTVLLGGFRNIVIDITWLEAIKLNEEREFFKLLAAYKTISLLQPNIALVWEFNAHNMAYNISSQALTPDEKERWVRRAIDFMREGIEKNPRTYRLYDFLASIYYFKIGRDNDLRLRFLQSGENPYLEALKHWREAGKQPDVRPTVITQQIHCLMKLWRFDEARKLTLSVLQNYPDWIPAGVIFHNRFEDPKYDGSVPYMSNLRLYKNWKEMN